MKSIISKAIKGQKTWVEYGRDDLRNLVAEFQLEAEEVSASDSIEMAIQTLRDKLIDGDGVGTLKSPIGDITIHESTLEHIVDKRNEARERYVNYAIKTIVSPYEIYELKYDDNSTRIVFIGAFKGKKQMLVIAKIMDDGDKWLWNFMHCNAKSLNRHRNGELIYCR